MTELARTPPVERGLFQTVDLAPLPHHRVIAEALDAAPVRADGHATGLYCTVIAENRPRTFAGSP